MNLKTLVVIILSLPALCGAGAESIPCNYSKWFNFEIKNRKTSKPLVDLSFLLDAPAGRHGFLKSKNGGFVFEDGTSGRFWGTTIHSALTLYPSHEQAEAIADTMSRYGINIVRLHLRELVQLDPSDPHKARFIADEEKTDRFDYFMKCFKERGIYILLDSVAQLDASELKDAKYEYGDKMPWTYYDPRLIELGKIYMKEYLHHVNKYTGKALIDEPGVAMIMIINEQSLFFDWYSKTVPEHCRNLAAKLFSGWLLSNYGTKENLVRSWTNEAGMSAMLPGENLDLLNVIPVASKTLAEPAGKWNSVNSPARIKDTIKFYQQLQTDYYLDMKKYLQSLGCRIPVGGTNIVYDVAELKTQSAMDYTSQNSYFDHAKYSPDKKLVMDNIPMTRVDPVTAFTETLIEQRVAAVKIGSLPVTSTESDVMWPHEWRSSYLLSLATTSSLQNWDAMLQYAYMGGFGYNWDQAAKSEKIMNPTVEFNDPAIYGTFPVSSLIYHRRDVSASKNLVQIIYDSNDAGCQKKEGDLRAAAFPFNYLTYVSRVECSFNKASSAASLVIAGKKPEESSGKPFMQYSRAIKSVNKQTNAVALDKLMKNAKLLNPEYGIQDGKIVSDTGELVRNWKQGLLSINTARTQGFTGFPGQEGLKFNDISIKCSSPFATIILSSLDNKPLAESSKIFLTAVGRAVNSNDRMLFDKIVKEDSEFARGENMTHEKGKDGKVITELVSAEINIKASAVQFTPLAPDMTAAGPSKTFTAVNDTVKITTGDGVPSIWYLLEVSR